MIYLAARYSRKDEIRSLIPAFETHGVLVSSRWLFETHAPDTHLNDLSPQANSGYALIDLEDVDRADTLVFFAEDPLTGTPRGGRHVEFGYALGKGKRIVVIGEPENIFHFLPGIEHYATVGDFLNAIN